MRDSRRNQDSGDDRRLYRVGKILPFEVQAQRFCKIRDSLIDCFTLTDDVNVKAPSDEPRHFVGHRDRELHEHNRTSGLRQQSEFSFCPRVGADVGGP